MVVVVVVVEVVVVVVVVIFIHNYNILYIITYYLLYCIVCKYIYYNFYYLKMRSVIINRSNKQFVVCQNGFHKVDLTKNKRRLNDYLDRNEFPFLIGVIYWLKDYTQFVDLASFFIRIYRLSEEEYSSIPDSNKKGYNDIVVFYNSSSMFIIILLLTNTNISTYSYIKFNCFRSVTH